MNAAATPADAKATLHRYLRSVRGALLWKLEGLDEYSLRRPLTPTGTNLLGLVKHLSMTEAGYFGLVFDRPMPGLPSWIAEVGADQAEPNADMWATSEEPSADLLELYRRVCAHSDRTIEELELDSIGRVPWWGASGETTLHRILVHMIAETNRHAGHADIVRELVDGAAGLREDVDNLPDVDAAWWAEYHDRVEQVARRFR